MVSLFSEEAISALVSGLPKKVSQHDDTASTASGASSHPISAPSSPGMSDSSSASVPASPGDISNSPEASNSSSVETCNSSSPETCSSSALNLGFTSESLKDLPSVGSLGHFAGLCSRCCFHSKGRCQNGHDCRFCHFDHEKRQRKKKIDFKRGYPAVPDHQPLQNLGFYNEEWRSTCQLPEYLSARPAPISQYASAPPGLEFNMTCPPPLPLSNNWVAPPVPAPPLAFAPAGLGPITRPVAEAPHAVGEWPVDRVTNWLTSEGLGHLSNSFEEHRITGDVLLELESGDLDEIGIRAFGDKKRLLKAVAQLRAQLLGSLETRAGTCQLGLCPAPPTPAPCWQAPSLEATSPWGFSTMAPLTPPPSFHAPLL